MLEAALLVSLVAAKAADLPPGAVLRLGDARWRAGGWITRVAVSPDGRQIATVETGTDAFHDRLTLWDADTGRPVRHADLNGDLFHGFVWGEKGAYAVVSRVVRDAKTGADTLVPDDFRVWAFADPNAAPPPVFPRNISFTIFNGMASVVRPQGGPEYTSFLFAANGRRVAAVHKSPGGKQRVDVFDLKPTDTAAALVRVRSIDLAADDDGRYQLSTDGGTLVGARKLPGQDRSVTNPEYVVAVWDVATGKASAMRVRSAGGMSLTPDARSLLVSVGWTRDETGGYDLLDLTTGKARPVYRAPPPQGPADEYEGEGEPSDGFAFLPSGRAYVSADGRRAVATELASGKELGRLEGHGAPLSAVAVSADGRRIVTADDAGLIRVWDAATLRPLTPAVGHRAMVEHAELSPDGKRLVTWARDQTVRVWDVATGKELRAFAGAIAPNGALFGFRQQPTFTPDGLAVVFGSKEGLSARDVLTGLAVPLPGDLGKLKPAIAVFAPDGKAVLTWESGNRFLAVWDWPSGKRRFVAEDVMFPESPGFSPDGSVVYATATSGERWDAKTGKPLPPAWKEDRTHSAHELLSLRSNPRHLIHHADGGVRVIGAGTDSEVPDVRLRQPSGEWTGWHGGWGVAVSPTGRQFAYTLGIGPHEVEIREAASGDVRRVLRGFRGGVRVLGFTPDGTKLLTAGADHTVLVWDVRLQSVPLPDSVPRETSAAKLWATMCAGKPDAAYLAMARLATEPDAAVKIARLRMKPATVPTAVALDRILRDLADPEFAVREAAERELDAYGEPAAALVKARLAKLESAEARRRAEAFVARWTGAGLEAVRLADARAVELLESLGTPAAREFLKELAAGEATAARTREAKRTLERATAQNRSGIPWSSPWSAALRAAQAGGIGGRRDRPLTPPGRLRQAARRAALHGESSRRLTGSGRAGRGRRGLRAGW